MGSLNYLDIRECNSRVATGTRLALVSRICNNEGVATGTLTYKVVVPHRIFLESSIGSYRWSQLAAIPFHPLRADMSPIAS